MFNKKAAMFGLDARIALAIFGALSVISGAALYSAIQQSRVVSYVAEFNELAKAVEQYMLDTGVDLPKRTGLNYMAESEELKTSTANGWNGPYFSSTYNATSKGFISKMPDPDSIYTVDVVDDSKALGDTVHSGSSGCLSAAPSCHYWIRVIRVELATAQAIDAYVDGVDDSDAGNVRYSYHTGTAKYFVWFKGPRTLAVYTS
tara:strand:+ start:1196 stop:1804 length:609 start_codon:yes stop_codon:yes gene_type:complete